MNGDIADLKNDVGKILEHLNHNHTAFHETKTVGSEILAASTTTIPPNQRFAVVRDNDHLNPDEVDSEITFDTPLYDFSNAANQEMIFRTRERNQYFVGQEAVCGFSFQIDTSIPNDQFLPNDATYEGGYGGLESGTLTGVPVTSDWDKDGVFLHIEPDLVDVRTYKSGTVQETVEKANWKFDPFADDTYQYDLSKFAAFRWGFDLYGAGDATLFARLARDDGSESDLKELVTIADSSEPLLEIFDMPVSQRVETAGTAVNWSSGPMHYFNKTAGEPPSRGKAEVIRDPSVSAGFPAYDLSDGTAMNTPTVIRVYRLDPDTVEVVTRIADINLNSPDADARIETREVHRDFLDFSGGSATNPADPDNDDNWVAPDDQRTRDTAVQKWDEVSGTATISTHEDAGRTITRGKQDAVAYTEGGGGKQSQVQGSAADETTHSELTYVALLGWIVGNNNPANIEVKWTQRF